MKPTVFVVIMVILFYMTRVYEHLEPAILPPTVINIPASGETPTILNTNPETDIPTGTAPAIKGERVMSCYAE